MQKFIGQYAKKIIILLIGTITTVLLFLLLCFVINIIMNGTKVLTSFVPTVSTGTLENTASQATLLSEKKLKSDLYLCDFEDGTSIKFSAGEIVTSENGKAWNLNTIHSAQKNVYFGNKEWTDYRTSVDLLFTDNCDKEADNQFKLLTRARNSELYGEFYYAACLEKGDTLKLTRAYASTVRVPGNSEIQKVKVNYLDGKEHKLTIDVLDNQIVVLWDGQTVIEYIDTTGSQILVGGVGVGADQTEVIIDDILVQSIYDSKGEDSDNKQVGNYDK